MPRVPAALPVGPAGPGWGAVAPAAVRLVEADPVVAVVSGVVPVVAADSGVVPVVGARPRPGCEVDPGDGAVLPSADRAVVVGISRSSSRRN